MTFNLAALFDKGYEHQETVKASDYDCNEAGEHYLTLEDGTKAIVLVEPGSELGELYTKAPVTTGNDPMGIANIEKAFEQMNHPWRVYDGVVHKSMEDDQ